MAETAPVARFASVSNQKKQQLATVAATILIANAPCVAADRDVFATSQALRTKAAIEHVDTKDRMSG